MKYALIFFSMLLLFSCENDGEMSPGEGSPGVSKMALPPESKSPQNEANDAVSIAELKNEIATLDENLPGKDNDNISTEKKAPRKIADKMIKEGDISIEVFDFKKAESKIKQMVKSHGAYIGNEDVRTNDYRVESRITIRVPNNKFDALMDGVSGIEGKVDNKSVNLRDVTEEYLDIEIRLKTKRETLKRYYDILSRASKVEDILAVERRINQVSEEIESAEGRLRYLDDKVNYSTINLLFYQEFEYQYEPEPRPNFFQRLLNGLDDGWGGFQELIIILFTVWPLWIVIGLLIWIIRRVVRKRNRKS